MSMQYLSSLYIWLKHIQNNSTIWEHEIARNCLDITWLFRGARFMWRDCEVEIL